MPLKFGSVMSVLIIAFFAGSCGTTVPQMEEAWEPVELPLNMEYRIKDHIFCETVKALRSARRNILIDGRPAIPDDYGVQMQVTLTAEESTTFNPGVTLNRTLKDAFDSGTRVGQSFNLGFGGNLSSTATRTDTMYSYYNIGRISGEGKNTRCDKPKEQHGSSLLLQSNLGIEEFLQGAATQSRIFPSSRVPSKVKDAKVDIFSYDVKFVIVTNGNVNPMWKLVHVSANTGSGPLFEQGRTRTHELVLTFGPGEADPSQASLQTHFTSQIVQQLNRLERNTQ